MCGRYYVDEWSRRLVEESAARGLWNENQPAWRRIRNMSSKDFRFCNSCVKIKQ